MYNIELYPREMTLAHLGKLISDLAQENAELRAQLARCKNDLTLIVKSCRESEWQTVGDCLLDIEAVIACLPKTASLDAEIVEE